MVCAFRILELSGEFGTEGDIDAVTVQLKLYCSRPELQNPASECSEIRILCPLTSSGFDAVHDSGQKHDYAHSYPGEPEDRHQKIKLRRERVSSFRSEGSGYNENSEGQYQAGHYGEYIDGLQQKCLQCVKRDKLRISFNQEDRERGDPPEHDLQHVGQESDGALILGRLGNAGMNWFDRDSSSGSPFLD